MTFEEYEEGAARTAGTPLECSIMGLAGEVGEFVDMMKKHLYHGHALVQEAAMKELGDILWYIADISRKLDFTLEDVAAMNLEKLWKRYGGPFSQERSINRVENQS